MSDELERRETRSFAWWAAAPLLTGGLLAPVPFLVAGSRTHIRAYWWASVVWTLMVIASIACIVIAGNDSGGAAGLTAGALIIVNMLGATAHTIAIRHGVGRELALNRTPELVDAERRADTRTRARAIARRDPKRALELGVGRPDIEGSFDGGLIDVNHAPPAMLAQLPGIDHAQAARIVELRMNGTGFVSVEDLSMVLDLDPGVAEELAARAVFLPRY